MCTNTLCHLHSFLSNQSKTQKSYKGRGCSSVAECLPSRLQSQFPEVQHGSLHIKELSGLFPMIKISQQKRMKRKKDVLQLTVAGYSLLWVGRHSSRHFEELITVEIREQPVNPCSQLSAGFHYPYSSESYVYEQCHLWWAGLSHFSVFKIIPQQTCPQALLIQTMPH